MIFGLALLAGLQRAAAQQPVIDSLSQNGTLTSSGLYPGSSASIEWASSVSGPWHTDWSSLTTVPVSTNGILTVGVPMFYRVRGFNSNYFATDGTVLIPAGSFTMGDTLDGEADAVPTNVFVSGFYMDTNSVTYSKWQTVYNWATNHGYVFANPGAGYGPNHPVQTVNWFDAVKWCNARSQMALLTPCYYLDSGFTQVLTTNTANNTYVYQNLVVTGYRLPTQAEWEKAARGQIAGARFPWGNTISQSLANYTANTTTNYDLGPDGNAWTNSTSPVGSFPPNGYGLYDMAGNVSQYTWDYSPFGIGITYYGLPTTNNPTGPLQPPGTTRSAVYCGGSWSDNAYNLRCAFHDYSGGLGKSDSRGFRCVRKQ